MSTSRFAFSPDQLRNMAADVLAEAKAQGATSAEVDISEGVGLSVTVRKGEVETIEHNRDKGVSLTVYIGQRKGNASTSDFSPTALKATVEAARNIARFTAEDDCAGLADAALLARNPADPGLHYPWDLDVGRAVEIATDAESAAFAVSPMIRNSEGATVSGQQSQFVYANSNGFSGGFASSRHYVACSVIAARSARDKNGMQRDDWYATARDPKDFPSAARIGDYAARRALARLGSRRISTRQCPVLFEAPLAASLISSLIGAISGGSLYRKTSFLLDSMGKQVLPSNVTITEDPDVPKGLASGPFDDEGVMTRKRDVVRDGVIQGYFLGSYSARKLGMVSTGNAGGSHNLVLHPTVKDDFAAMLKRLGSGLLVTDLIGHGVNMTTGDYSRGAAGYWVEKGEIVHPVEEITIAGNLKQMYLGLAAAGGDLFTRGSITTGSILIDRMTIAGE